MLAADFEVRRRHFTVRLELQVGSGERLAVLGRSGAGKTTCLEALAGLLPLSAGEIELNRRCLSSFASPGRNVRPGRRGVGLLRQNPSLFPHLTVLENISYPPGVTVAAATAAAQRMGLGRLLGARPKGLSGGEAQRVALCRALQTGVQLLCLDEPFSSLDRSLGLEMLELVRSEVTGSGTSAVLVTHQLGEAQAFAGRVAVLDRGSLLQVSEPRELVLRPKTAAVAALVGYRGWLQRGDQVMAIHPDRVRPLGSSTVTGLLDGRVVGMRPEGARIDVELESVGEWVGRFHCFLDEPPQSGARLSFEAPAAPVFTGTDAERV
ncbi:MAG: ATP-binding cassette domain-containing protein [Candidatus Dormiibacterota bacterium]